VLMFDARSGVCPQVGPQRLAKVVLPHLFSGLSTVRIGECILRIVAMREDNVQRDYDRRMLGKHHVTLCNAADL
jgi:hypothetical protein